MHRVTDHGILLTHILKTSKIRIISKYNILGLLSSPKMAMASTEKVVLGSISFALFWVMAVFPSVPFLPIGRTAGSLLGAILMVIFQVITPKQAYSAIDLPILGLLFGTMVVSVYLERADMFGYLAKFLSWKSRGAKDLLLRICLVSAISSALFTNDTTCIVLTEFVLKFSREKNFPPHPFLLALASSANIGSSATPIGNPQNLVIAIQSQISFGKFLLGIFSAMIVGVFVNSMILLCMYWKLLSVQKNDENANIEVVVFQEHTSHDITSSETLRDSNGLELEVTSDGFFQEREENFPSTNISSFNELTCDKKSLEEEEEEGGFNKRWKMVTWKTLMYLVTVGMLISFLIGMNMSWTAITAALALIVLDFKDAKPCLEKVSYSLLVFFCGMFITIDGFNKTGIPSSLWELMEPYAQVDQVGGIAVLAAVILVLSNLASNVPTVLMLGGRVAASAAAISSAKEKKAWLILAWVSTVAGNFSLLGSAANLIVCEQARRDQHLGYTLSFWTHLKFGLPSTLIVISIGLTLIKG